MGSGVKKPYARLLECPVGVQVVVERARGDAAELTADIGYRACLVGHEGLGVAQLLGGHDAGRPPLRPRARAALTPSRMRWRMTLRSISANAAWICRKARPAWLGGGVQNALQSASEFLARIAGRAGPHRRRLRRRSNAGVRADRAGRRPLNDHLVHGANGPICPHRSPAPTTAIVSLNHVTMAFPSTDRRGVMQAFDDVCLESRNNELAVALGASGCAKTTLLEVILRRLREAEHEDCLSPRSQGTRQSKGWRGQSADS